MTKAKKPPVDWAQRVADTMATYIEQNNTLPWLKGWTTNGIFPSNLVTKTEYKGINALILGMMGSVRGYSSPYYVTIKGMHEKGGTFKDWDNDASKNGLPIVWWNMLKVEDRKTGKDKIIPLLKGWTVYNLDHIDGIEVPKIDRPVIDVPDAVEHMFDQYPSPPRFTEELSATAHYSPSLDQIVIPKREQFSSLIQFAETKAHEGVHSTGHKSRLNRFDNDADVHAAYAKEELVAEIGAAILLQRLGMEPEMQRMADYVKGWGSRIKDDPKMLVSAAGKADHAVNLILNIAQEAREEVAA